MLVPYYNKLLAVAIACIALIIINASLYYSGTTSFAIYFLAYVAILLLFYKVAMYYIKKFYDEMEKKSKAIYEESMRKFEESQIRANNKFA